MKRLISSWNKLDIDNMVVMYNKGQSLREIANYYNTSRVTVTKLLKQENMFFRTFKDYTIRNHNHNFFDNIETERQAYWCGFIAADGCVIGNYLEIGLKKEQSEYELLKEFLKDLGSDTVISETRSNYSISIVSKQLVSNLIKYGIHERKSFTCEPAILPDNLMRHYWRGMVDGDGGIYPNYNQIGLSANYKIVSAFKTYCLRLNDKIKADIVSHHPIYRFHIKGENARPILNNLYKDSIVSLSRKYEAYEQVIDNLEQKRIGKTWYY